MKIIYIGFKYDYGDPKRGFSYEHYNFYDSLCRMDNGGHKIVYFPFDEIMQRVGALQMNELLIETALREKPDLCFFFIVNDEIRKETIDKITQKGILTFNWFADDQWRFDSFSKHYAPYFSWVGTTDSKAPEKYHKIGYTNVIKTQWACNHFLYKPINSEEKYGITFVGQPHGNRKKILEKVKIGAGVDIECWGRGWPKGRVSQEKMIDIFSNSDINLNLTENSHGPILKSIAKVFLAKNSNGLSFVSPVYWSDNVKMLLIRRRKQMKGRMFEVPGCGGFLVTGDADNLLDYYEDGKEIVVYKDMKDLIAKVGYYKDHPNERNRISLAGYKRTLREHTYEQRLRKVFKVMGLLA